MYLTIPHSSVDALMDPALDVHARRLAAMPPGTCPVASELALLTTAGLQTCGKCVPCRDGIPRMADIMRRILDCKASPEDLDTLCELATYVRDASDCAIGYQAAASVLEGLQTYAAEYRSHVELGECAPDRQQQVPCEAYCPAHVDVPAYIALAGAGDYAGAINMIRKDNPFPTACAFVCEHPCEKRCRRTMVDAPLNIRGIKKFAVDQLPADQVTTPRPNVPTGRRVAVVGGGPSGMTCAYFLALMGHSVTVYEARAELGGMMRYGIPAYRFPRERLDEDLRAITGAGDIQVVTGTYVTTAMLGQLADDFDAVYVAIGAHASKSLGLTGEDARGVSSAVKLLRAIGDGDYPDFTGKDVVVIGGGNVAMDCARTAVRSNSKSVSVVYRRRLEDMTALPAEVESAMAEGVEMLTLMAPTAIVTDDEGKVAGLEVQPQMIGPVKRGRPAPLDADKPRHVLDADIILVAIGQDIEAARLAGEGTCITADRGRLVADEHLRSKVRDNVFAGGDCVTGPATVIRAVAAGRVAARNIDEHLGYHHKLACDVAVPDAVPNDRTPKGRVNIAERPARERRHDFAGVEEPMSRQEALQECGRCLRCDVYGCGALTGGRTRYE